MIYVDDIVKICNGILYSGNSNIKCINFVKDSRLIKPGDIYVGIKGEKFNGNNFYKEAFNKGASVCLLDKDTKIDDSYKNKTIVLVDDTVNAIQELAKYKRSLYNIPVIAITGSVGKTSVKDMVYRVVNSKYKTLSTSGNMNNHIGVPLTILSLRDHEALIVEMGMNHLGEIDLLSRITKPTLAIITNVGTAHIGNLGSRENILKAKMEIVNGMDNGTLIINNDNDLLHTIKYDNLITVGIDNDSDYMASNIQDDVFSSSFYINGDYITIPIGSKAFVYNSLFAYAVGKKLDINNNKIITALNTFKLNPHRLELIKGKDYTIIDDTYNASLDSVNNALGMLSKVKGRKVFIFGDILELSEYAKDIHEKIGNSVVNNNVNVLICVGKETKATYDKVHNNITAYHFDNNDDMKKALGGIIRSGDTILVKGSHGMNLIEIVEYLSNR